MRKQYHFWPGEEGFEAWDVDRLIEAVRDLAVEQVPVDSISEVDFEHPIILGSDGRVMDGIHRIARAFLQGRETIDAVRLREVPAPDHRNVRPEDLQYD